MSKHTLVIGIGNRLRRDDGAGPRVLDLMKRDGVRVLEAMELLPEMSAEVAESGAVVFVDADYRPGRVELHRVEGEAKCRQALQHAVRTCDVVGLAQRLYKWEGEAWVCRVPGADFEEGEGLSETAEANVREAAVLLGGLLAQLRG